jgi:hypothetical protein
MKEYRHQTDSSLSLAQSYLRLIVYHNYLVLFRIECLLIFILISGWGIYHYTSLILDLLFTNTYSVLGLTDSIIAYLSLISDLLFTIILSAN